MLGKLKLTAYKLLFLAQFIFVEGNYKNIIKPPRIFQKISKPSNQRGV